MGCKQIYKFDKKPIHFMNRKNISSTTTTTMEIDNERLNKEIALFLIVRMLNVAIGTLIITTVFGALGIQYKIEIVLFVNTFVALWWDLVTFSYKEHVQNKKEE